MNETQIRAIFAIGGLLAGAGIGVVATLEVVKRRYQTQLTQEIQAVKTAYNVRAAKLEISEAAQASIEEAEEKSWISEKVEEVLEFKKAMNDSGYEEPDLEGLPDRDPSYPYVITTDEFMDDRQYQKLATSYFEKDQVLINDDDQNILEIDSTIGVRNLEFFGRASDDPNTVYIRNERHGTDFEVYRQEGAYFEALASMMDSDESDG